MRVHSIFITYLSREKTEYLVRHRRSFSKDKIIRYIYTKRKTARNSYTTRTNSSEKRNEKYEQFN